ncbi:hypothetical protein HK096_001609, partial [Nowakowskiella sp. JEL0078]
KSSTLRTGTIKINNDEFFDPLDGFDDEKSNKSVNITENSQTVGRSGGLLSVDGGSNLRRSISSLAITSGSSVLVGLGLQIPKIPPPLIVDPPKVGTVFNVDTSDSKEREQQIKMQVLAILQQQLTLQLNKNKKKKLGSNKTIEVPFPGGTAIPILKGVIKGKPVKNFVGELKIEELDEHVLRERLDALNKELSVYKEKCSQFKTENEWYREEIESCKKDTADYIKYLENKKAEKESTIQSLLEHNKLELEKFTQRRNLKEHENNAKIEELKNTSMELEMKLTTKQQELLQMSDIVVKRAKHQSEMAKLRQEMFESEREHQQKVAELERSLLESRIKMQKEADAKIHSMESAAQERAAKFLEDQTKLLDTENRKLETELHKIIRDTQGLLQRKERLEQKNRELAREQQVREDMVKLRLEKIRDSEKRNRRLKEKEKLKKNRNKTNEIISSEDEDQEYI